MYIDNLPGVVAGFSERADGTMAIQGGWDNRLHFLTHEGVAPETVVHAGLCHGARAAIVTRTDGGSVIPETDALVTADPGVTLCMTAADCLLVYGVDPTTGVIGLAHAGSRGLARRSLVAWLTTWQQARPWSYADLRLVISPSICARHYEVQADFARQFHEWPEAVRVAAGRMMLDLQSIAVSQLMSVGVRRSLIHLSTRCTYEDAELFSYRRDHPVQPQLQLGWIRRA